MIVVLCSLVDGYQYLAQPAASIISPGDRSRRFVQRVHRHVPNYMELQSKYIIVVLILAEVTLLALL